MIHEQGNKYEDNFWLFNVINFADYLVHFLELHFNNIITLNY
jgi:hypothetical protein